MAEQSYVFRRTQKFRSMFEALSQAEQAAARETFKTFKANPKDKSLRPHKINRLSSLLGKTVRSVTIKGDLRAVFIIEGNVITSIGIGTHKIYE